MKQLPILVVAGLVLLHNPGFGQTGGDNGGHKGGEYVEKHDPTKSKRVVYEKRGSGMAEITYHIDGHIQERMIPPRQVVELRRLGTIGTQRSGDIHAVVSVRPSALAPGQSGELFVVVSLGGSAVALPGRQAELKLDASGTPLQFGSPKLDSAAIGKLPGSFRGKPAYEDTMMFRVPVKVAANASSPQEAAFKGTLVLALYENETGHVQGTFFHDITGAVNVRGNAVPVPIETDSDEGQHPTQRGTSGDGETANATSGNSGNSPAGGAGSLVNAEEAPQSAAAVDPTQKPEGNRLVWILGILGGAGLLVLGVIFVLASRRR